MMATRFEKKREEPVPVSNPSVDAEMTEADK